MTTRERLAKIMCCGTDECRADVSNRRGVLKVPCSAGMYRGEVDAILDELMEPGEGALERGAGFTGQDIGGMTVGARDEARDIWRAILTHIKAEKE